MIDFSILKHVSDSLYYDGPILSTYSDSSGNEYLVYWVDQNDKFNTWLLCNPSKDTIKDLREGKIDLRSVIDGCSSLALFNQSNTDLCFNQRSVTIQEIESLDYLPEPGHFLQSNQP